MVEEKRSWILRLVLSIVAVVLVALLICWLFPMPNLNPFYDKIFSENISTMKKAARNYYTTDRLPAEVGQTMRMTLAEMENSKIILPFSDKDSKKCDGTNSYIQVTKTLDQEYALKIQLSCNDKVDYVIDTIGCNGTCYIADGDETSSSSSSSSTTKPNTNPSKPGNGGSSNNGGNTNVAVTKYTVKFNSNGGNAVASKTVTKGNTVSAPSNPTRNGYTFAGWYLNGHAYDFGNAVTSNITLTAEWNKNADGGSSTNKTFYYQHAPLMKDYLSDWTTSTPYGNLYDQETRQVAYYNYCPRETTDMYYSVGYILKSQYDSNKNSKGVWSYTYTLQLKNLSARFDRYEIAESSRMSDTTQFSNYIKTRDENITWTGGSSNTSSKITSASAQQMKESSLNSNNFNVTVGKPYTRSGKVYVDIDIEIRNINKIDPYKAWNVSEPVYFVPLKFKIRYENTDKCVYDSEYNWHLGVMHYVDSRTQRVYRPYVMARDMNKAIWSTQSYVSGYEATGRTEWR